VSKPQNAASQVAPARRRWTRMRRLMPDEVQAPFFDGVAHHVRFARTIEWTSNGSVLVSRTRPRPT